MYANNFKHTNEMSKNIYCCPTKTFICGFRRIEVHLCGTRS